MGKDKPFDHLTAVSKGIENMIINTGDLSPKEFKTIVNKRIRKCVICHDPARGKYCVMCEYDRNELITCPKCRREFKRKDSCICEAGKIQKLGLRASTVLNLTIWEELTSRQKPKAAVQSMLIRYGLLKVTDSKIVPNNEAIQIHFEHFGLSLPIQSLQLLARISYPTNAREIRKLDRRNNTKSKVANMLKQAREWGYLKRVDRPAGANHLSVWFDKTRKLV